MVVGVIGACFSSQISSAEFLTLNANGSKTNCLILVVSSWERLYAGAFLQLTTGRIGWAGLCSFIRPFIVGAEGFRFTYLHFESLGMRVVLWFMVFQIWFWKLFVGLVVEVWKLFLSMKSCIFVLYCILLLVFPQMWQFPYPFGFCNPVRIYGRKIDDDDDDEYLKHTTDRFQEQRWVQIINIEAALHHGSHTTWTTIA